MENQKNQSNVTVTKINAGKYPKKSNGVMVTIDQAEIRQTIELPSSGGNALFSNSDLGLSGGTSTRVGWIDVPTGSTPEEIQAKIDSRPDLRLSQVLSFDVKDCLTETQLASITALNPATGLPYSKIEDFMSSKAYRTNVSTKDPVTGEVVKTLTAVIKDGKPVYRGIFFNDKQDQDLTLNFVEQEFSIASEVNVEQTKSVLV